MGIKVRSSVSSAPNIDELFDKEWYLEQNPDVAAADVDPLLHFLKFGAAERRDPNPLFDTDWYLSGEPNIDADVNPLVHYLTLGAAEGRNPHPLFDTDWYRTQNTEIVDQGLNPLTHFIRKGLAEGLDPSPLFQEDWSAFPVSGNPEVTILATASRELPKPKISVIVPVFNKLPYLKECLDSLIAQSHSANEIICIDDCSTDESTNLLLDYAARNRNISVVRLGVNSGAAVARNVGLEFSSGDFIQFTDADDILPRDGIESLYHIATTDGVELVRGSLGVFNNATGSGRIIPEGPRLTKRNFIFTDERTLWVPWGHTCFLFSRRMLVGKEIVYPNLRDGEDPVFLAMVLVNAGKMSSLGKITYLARNGTGYDRKALAYIIDFVRHVAIVKKIFLASAPECWVSGYRRFLIRQHKMCFLRGYERSIVGRKFIQLALERAGLGSEIKFNSEPARAFLARMPPGLRFWLSRIRSGTLRLGLYLRSQKMPW